MPRIFKFGPYWVYFWSNKNKPLEPIHVHIAEGKPIENSTKIWITQTGKCLLANNNSNIPDKTLRLIFRLLEANSNTIISKWIEHFGSITYYC